MQENPAGVSPMTSPELCPTPPPQAQISPQGASKQLRKEDVGVGGSIPATTETDAYLY